MFKIPAWLIAVVALNAVVIIIALRISPDLGLSSLITPSSNEINLPNSSEIKNETILNKSSNQTLNKTLNQTLNDSYYISKCKNSISNYVKTAGNITSFTAIETRLFNKTENAISYVVNLSNRTFETAGIGGDIYNLDKSIVSLNDFKARDGKNYTLPVVCDVSGNIGDYSSCILSNITNITFYCHNITVSVSECDIEKANYGFWDDISYWITPKPGDLNQTQKFNFTITSSRNRLEYATLNVYYVRPPITNKNLFNQSKATTKGDKISITTTLNLTGKTFGGLIVETYFKKRCYKYIMISQYLY